MPINHDKRRCCARRCKATVAPSRLMCYKHWCMVPSAIQRRVWAHYKPGQEHTGGQTREYLEAARDAIRAVAAFEGNPQEENGPAE